ncbi:CAAX family protease [Trabulsiella guamensis ATCC 49490]|uniref:CAAX family protease n=1 Tax=Trabulsiella guamensis ATCC 49490 TaxID=1005994 RepID=A0A084ZMK4_9ENTR|nr:type II CAAX endopeptidase family protein [Trabulsiella guamensis]KFB98698.1 CAAX family protease [Trabulsiella guamensis ATCC 49490]
MSNYTIRLAQSLWYFGMPTLWYGLSIFTGIWVYNGTFINPAYSFVLFVLISFIIITPCWLLYKEKYGTLTIGRFSGKLMLQFVAVLAPVLILTNLMTTEENNWFLQVIDSSVKGWLAVILAMVFFAPIVEEIIFRGFLLQGFLIWLPNNRLACCVLVSLIFSAAHVQYKSNAIIAELIILSLFFCYVRIISKGLLMPVLCHMLTNAIILLWYYLGVV